MLKAMVPWYVRIVSKLILSRLPMTYSVWKAFGLFSHGYMENPKYAYDTFMFHYEKSGMASRRGGFVGLEMGPGDSLLSAVLAKACGATCYYLVDVGPFANENVEACQRMAAHAGRNGLTAPDLEGARTINEVLDRCNAIYMTDGLSSYRKIPDKSVDFVWSQAVLEHVRRGEFAELMGELRRILKPGGVSTHQVDLKDHLGGALNNMRLGSDFWEKDWVANSGFYTNRIRFREMCEIFESAGFQVEVLKTTAWSKAPTSSRSFAPEFGHLKEDELLVSDFFAVLTSK